MSSSRRSFEIKARVSYLIEDTERVRETICRDESEREDEENTNESEFDEQGYT